MLLLRLNLSPNPTTVIFTLLKLNLYIFWDTPFIFIHLAKKTVQDLSDFNSQNDL